MNPVAIPVTLFIMLGLVAIFRGPIGRAIAQRITAGRRRALTHDPDTAEHQHRAAELDELQRRLAEVEERLDFTERVLSERRQSDRAIEGR